MKMYERSTNPSGTSQLFAYHQRFTTPEDILIDRGLGGHEQRRLLDDWKLELELLTNATAENMPDRNGQTGRGQPEELLRRVNACRRLLGEQGH